MTAPDNGLEEALRRALAEAVSHVEPGTDALERIRARIGQRPPRPWLVSVVADVLGQARHLTWRGHWAWQLPWAWPTVPALSALPWPRLRRLPRPGAPLRDAALLPDLARSARPVGLDSVSWLRPVAVLAGIGIIASVSFGVQPFRQAIIQASNTVLTGGQPPSGGAGTEGSGTPTGDVASSSVTGMPPADTYGTTPGRGAIGSSNAASPSPAPSAACPPSLLAGWTSVLGYPKAAVAGSVTSAQPDTAADLAPSPTPTPSPSCASATSPAASPTPTPATTSPTSPTPTPATTSPTATPTGMSPTATPTGTSPTATPTGTSPTATPTGTSPTATPTDTGVDTGDGGPPVSATPTATSS